MKLDPNNFLLSQVPDNFASFFPSEDALADGKFTALRTLDKSIGASRTVLETARTFSAALQRLTAQKAVFVGDFLQSWMPKIAWVEGASLAASNIKGLWAQVPWKASTDPAELSLALTEASINIALTAISAVPVVGLIGRAVVSTGRLLHQMFEEYEASANASLALPWAEYAKESDEEIVGILEDTVFTSVDWMPIFSPPFEPKPWRVGVRSEDGHTMGLIWGPTSSPEAKELAWATNAYGVMPGSFRVAGQTQTAPGSTEDTDLRRLIRWPKGWTPREQAIPWRKQFVACGDYYPALAQAGGCAWQWVMKVGNPDMFKVDALTLLSLWEAYWAAFWDSAWDVFGRTSDVFPTDIAVGPMRPRETRRFFGHLLMPYLAVRRRGEQTWNLGVPFAPTPEPTAWVHPDIFRVGPVPVAERNPCLFVEEAYPQTGDWPYKGPGGRLPKQHPSLRPEYRVNATTPATTQDPGPGWACIPYPTAEQAAASYASPFEVFIKPVLQQLRKMQFAALEQTLVCAYVRPTALEKLPQYAAFRDPLLRNHCQQLRAKLLQHPARFGVSLADVEELDPPFAAALRASGVTGTWRDQLRLREVVAAGGPLKDGDPLPEAPPIEGGVAFGDLASDRAALPRPGSLDAAPLLVGAAALAGAGLLFALRRGQRVSLDRPQELKVWRSSSTRRSPS